MVKYNIKYINNGYNRTNMDILNQYIVFWNGKILNISGDIKLSIGYIETYINNILTLLKEYDGNVIKFMNDLDKIKIIYYSNTIDQGYYYLDNNLMLCASNTRLKEMNHKILIDKIEKKIIFNKTTINEINSIFIPDNEQNNSVNNIECKMSIDANDIKIIKNQSTESLINSCLNNEIMISEDKKNKMRELRDTIKELERKKAIELAKVYEKERKEKIKMKNIELKRKQFEDKEQKYRQKLK